jgi:hypothetical protein
MSTIPGCFPGVTGAAMYAGYVLPPAIIVVMLPGTGPETGIVVTAVARLPCCAFVHPARNTVTIRVQAQKKRRRDLFIRFHRLLVLAGDKKYLVMMIKYLR